MANQCQHPKCGCEIKSGEEFCSPACGALASEAAQLRCDCGHPGCAEAQLSASETPAP